jgi:DNA primase
LLGLSKPAFWQARAWQAGRSPKYLGPAPRPPSLVALWGSAEVPTLTEDILSAMKVGMVGEGWAVMGTSVSPAILGALLARGGRVNVWTDPDPAGRKAASKITKQLLGFGLEVRNILSQRDPKLHHLSEIKEILCG